MITISFGRWSQSAGPKYVRERILWSGYRLFGVYGWTPFCRVHLRSVKAKTNIYLPKGLLVPEAMAMAAAKYEEWGREWPEFGAFEYNSKTGIVTVIDNTQSPAPPTVEREDDPDGR